MTGPFETREQASEIPGAQAVYAAFRKDPSQGHMVGHNDRMITDACAAAGVELGAYDQRIIKWLGGWEPEICAVVAGLVTRASGRDTR